MATAKPRVQVVLDDETKALFDEAASLLGISTSKMVANVCVDSAPAVRQVVEMVKRSRLEADPVGSMLSMAKQYVVDARQQVADAQFDIEDVISSKTNKNRS